MAFFGDVLQKVLGIAPRLKKRTFDPEAMSEEDIDLPSSIMNFDKEDMRLTIKREIDTFRVLGYKEKTLDELKVEEYHSLQIGLMLKYVKEGKYFPIEKIEQLLPDFVLGATNKQLHIKVYDLVYRYDNIVNKESSLNDLAKEIIWTPQEAAYLLRYINLENRIIVN